MLRRKEDEKGLCKYLQSESYQVVADMYIHGGCYTYFRKDFTVYGCYVTLERMCAVQLQRLLSSSKHALCLNSVKLLAVRTEAGKLLKTVEARMMGEFMKTTVFAVGRTKCSGCRTDRVYFFSGRISLIKWFGTFFTERR